MRRRKLLTALCGAIILSGCTGESRDQQIGLGRIELSNQTADPLGVRVLVDRDGERVYENTLTVASTHTIVEQWMGEQTPYDVTVTVPDDPRETSVTWQQLERMIDEWGDAECYEIAVVFRSDELVSFVRGTEACP